MNKKGAALVIAITFVAVLTVLTDAFLRNGISEGFMARRHAASTRAFWAAEAGIQKALWEFRHNNCAGLFQEGTTTPCTTCSNCGNRSKTFGGTLGSGDYDIVMDYLNTNITSTGFYPGRNAANRIQRKLQLDSGTTFKYAFFAKHNVTLSNNSVTDGYDSSQGAYGSGSPVNVDNAAGSVGSNDTVANTIIVNNGSTVNGRVTTGVPLPGVNTVTNNGTIAVLPVTYTGSLSLPSVSVPSGLTSLSPSGVTINNDTTLGVTGESHDYKYREIDLSPNKTLTFKGTVRLYLTGTASSIQVKSGFKLIVEPGGSVTIYTDGPVNLTNNGDVNNPNVTPASTGIPSKFAILTTYSGANGIQIANSGAYYGTVYAPDTEIQAGANSSNTQFFGAMAGKAISLANNTPMHFDKTLAGSVDSSTKIWQEL